MHWKGVAYGRDGESLKPLNQAKQILSANSHQYQIRTAQLDQLPDQ